MIKSTIRSKIILAIGIASLGSIFVAFFLSFVLLSKLVSGPPPAPIIPSLRDELCEKLDGINTEMPCLITNKFTNKTLAAEFLTLFERKFKPTITTYDEVINLFDSRRLREVTPFYMDTNFHQFDLTGTGLNRIIISSDNSNTVNSIVFIRPEMLIPFSESMVIGLCDRLDLINSPLCEDNAVVYQQDFLALIQEKYSDQPDAETLLTSLMPYAYIENPKHYNLFFHFGDNVNTRILFYFNTNKVLENLVLLRDFAEFSLNEKVLADLCQKLNLDERSDKCKPNSEIFTSDLEEEIRIAFPVGIATYEDVQAVLGKYQFRFDYPVKDADGNAVTSSIYDLSGSETTILIFEFDTEFVVTNIRFECGSGCRD